MININKLKKNLFKPIYIPLLLRVFITCIVIISISFLCLVTYVAVCNSSNNMSKIIDLKNNEIGELRTRIENLENDFNQNIFLPNNRTQLQTEEYDCSNKFQPIQITIPDSKNKIGFIHLKKAPYEHEENNSSYIIEVIGENGFIWSDVVNIWACIDESAHVIVEDVDHDGKSDIRIILGSGANLSNTYQTIFIWRDTGFKKVNSFTEETSVNGQIESKFSEILPSPLEFTKNNKEYDAVAQMSQITAQSYTTIYYKWDEGDVSEILLKVVKVELFEFQKENQACQEGNVNEWKDCFVNTETTTY